jgi:hypothetical protein
MAPCIVNSPNVDPDRGGLAIADFMDPWTPVTTILAADLSQEPLREIFDRIMKDGFPGEEPSDTGVAISRSLDHQGKPVVVMWDQISAVHSEYGIDLKSTQDPLIIETAYRVLESQGTDQLDSDASTGKPVYSTVVGIRRGTIDDFREALMHLTAGPDADGSSHRTGAVEVKAWAAATADSGQAITLKYLLDSYPLLGDAIAKAYKPNRTAFSYHKTNDWSLG